MADEQSKLEQDQQEKPMTLLAFTVFTGLFGGIFWSSIAYLAYVFNFTEIRPNFILDPWTIGDWKKGWLGIVIAIILIGIVSIVAALIYYFALRKFKYMYVGIAYGLVLFLLVFYVLNPIFPSIEPLRDLDRNTIITTICFYVLFGTFVGYSISYEQEEQKKLHEAKQKEVRTT